MTKTIICSHLVIKRYKLESTSKFQ